MKKLTIGLISLLGFTLCTLLSSSAFAAGPQPGARMMYAPWMSAPPAYRAQMARMAAQRYLQARQHRASPRMARSGPWMAAPRPMMRPTQGQWRQAAMRAPMRQIRPQQRRWMAPQQRTMARAPAPYYGRPMWRQAQRAPMTAYRPMMRAQRTRGTYAPPQMMAQRTRGTYAQPQMMAQRARMQGYRPMYQARRPMAPMYRGGRYAQGPARGNLYQRPMMARGMPVANTYRVAQSPRRSASVPPTQLSALGTAMLARALR